MHARFSASTATRLTFFTMQFSLIFEISSSIFTLDNWRMGWKISLCGLHFHLQTHRNTYGVVAGEAIPDQPAAKPPSGRKVTVKKCFRKITNCNARIEKVLFLPGNTGLASGRGQNLPLDGGTLSGEIPIFNSFWLLLLQPMCVMDTDSSLLHKNNQRRRRRRRRDGFSS